MSGMRYRVTSRRLAGFAEGDLVSGDGLESCGINVARAVIKGHVTPIGYNEPKKKGGRKDASDTDKD